MISMIVGLGNPGSEYIKTRHNAGFLLLDKLAENHGVSFSYQSKFNAEAAKATIADKSVWLIKPQLYMNKSGSVVSSYAKYFNVKESEILVAHDELDLQPGTVRLKLGGGHGGHNGLRDIIACLGSREFYRLRLGIGHPGDKRKVVDYVLKKAGKTDQIDLEEAVCRAIEQLPEICKGETQKVMKELNSI